MMENKKIAIIDADSLAFAIGNGNKIIESYDEFSKPIYKKNGNKLVYIDKTLQELQESADYWMNTIMSRGNFTHYIMFIKGRDTTRQKLLIDPTYKSDRIGGSPHWWNDVKRDLIDRYKAYEANYWEVDDFVLSASNQIEDSFIVAIDSDILGTEGTHYNWKKNTWGYTSKEQEEIKFWQEMITGSHNGTKGLKGRGEKYFQYLIQDVSPFDSRVMGMIIFEAYVEYYNYNYNIALEEFYKNFKMLELKKDLDISSYTLIEWENKL